MADLTLVLELQGRDAGAKAAVDGLHQSLGKLGTQAETATQASGGLFSTLAGGAAAGLGMSAFNALTSSLGGWVQGALKAEETSARLEAVLASTGGVAGVTHTAVDDLAKSLSGVTTYGGNAIREADALLLTFTHIGQDVFPQATETVLNMSTALGQDLKSSSIQLGKALQDPILGVTALRRVGVMLSDDQEKQVKAFMAVGDAASAQRIILGELETEFGGMARAAGGTLSGQMQIAQRSIESVGRTIVAALLPTVADLLTALVPLVQDALPGIKDGALAFAGALRELGPPLKEVIGFLIDHRDVVAAVAAGFATFVVLSTVVGWVAGAVTAFTALGATLSALMAGGGALGAIVAILGGPVTLALVAVGVAVGVLTLAWTNNWGDIQGKTEAVVGWIQEHLPEIETVLVALGGPLVWLAQQFVEHWDDIQATVAAAWTWINDHGELIKDVLFGLVAPLGVLRQAWINDWGGIQETVAGVADWLTTTALPALGVFFSGLGTVIHTALSEGPGSALALLSHWGVEALNNLSASAVKLLNGAADAGAQIVAGLQKGIADHWQAFTDWLTGGFDALLQAVKDHLGIKSPSTTWASQVGTPMGEGVIAGAQTAIAAGTPTLLAAADTVVGAVAAQVQAGTDAVVVQAQQALALVTAAMQGARQAITGGGSGYVGGGLQGLMDVVNTGLTKSGNFAKSGSAAGKGSTGGAYAGSGLAAWGLNAPGLSYGQIYAGSYPYNTNFPDSSLFSRPVGAQTPGPQGMNGPSYDPNYVQNAQYLMNPAGAIHPAPAGWSQTEWNAYINNLPPPSAAGMNPLFAQQHGSVTITGDINITGNSPAEMAQNLNTALYAGAANAGLL